MNKEQLEKRKKLIAELILENEFYVPMKTKEIAILLQIPKSQRGELQEVLDSLVSDGTIGVWIGHQFGNRFEKKAELLGGIILVAIGIKILVEHLLETA